MEHTFNLRQISKKKKEKRKKKRIERKEGRKEGRKRERKRKKGIFQKKKRRNQSGQWWHMPLIAALGKQRQTD